MKLLIDLSYDEYVRAVTDPAPDLNLHRKSSQRRMSLTF